MNLDNTSNETLIVYGYF